MLACVQVQPCQRREVFFKVEFIHPVLLNCNVSILKTLQEEKRKKERKEEKKRKERKRKKEGKKKKKEREDKTL